jgi:hypothetical protein
VRDFEILRLEIVDRETSLGGSYLRKYIKLSLGVIATAAAAEG